MADNANGQFCVTGKREENADNAGLWIASLKCSEMFLFERVKLSYNMFLYPLVIQRQRTHCVEFM